MFDAAAPAAHEAPGLSAVSATAGATLERALRGEPLKPTKALELLNTETSAEIGALIATAGFVRTSRKGRRLTYSPKVFVPVTNLCRDRCAYCTFRADPEDAQAWTMLPEEIRASSRQANKLRCIEALMCLGDKPEVAFKSYRHTLAALGHESTISYVGQACEIAIQEGLLPHTNAGLMSRDEMRALKPVNVSMGLMLENISPRLRGKGEAHHHAPDKDPVRRLQMIREAGELQIPFTTGILLGIGENRAEVIDSLVAIAQAHADFGHIQEIIIQNFRAKPTTKMAAHPEPENVEIAKVIAIARLMMPDMNIQAPPNLSPSDHRLLIDAGINDWGGISPLTPDFVNPEAPWPHIAALAQTCTEAGFALRPRLPIYADYVERSEFLDSSLHPHVVACAADRGVELC